MTEESITLKKLREKFPQDVLGMHSYRGDDTAIVDREHIVEVGRFLRDDPQLDYNFMMDLTGVDYLGRKPRFIDHNWLVLHKGSSYGGKDPRFEVVYHLYSLKHNHRVRLKAPVPEKDCTIDSIVSLWEGANWFEREAFDMYGIEFKGHPDLRRLLMYEGFIGHPLRKDYPKDKEQPLDKVSSAPKITQKEGSGEGGDGLEPRHMFLNMGPAHPAMHGVIHLVLELDGERVIASDTEIGYLHRGFEKESEAATYTQVIPYTDRLNYVSPLINNVGYALAVEKLFGVEVPERCKYIRVIMSELSRMADHLTCIAASAMELGAFTIFFYFMEARELLYQLWESAAGGRITPAYTRIGGLANDLPAGFVERARYVLKENRKALDEVSKLLDYNRIFYDRMRGVGAISAPEAMALGFTGPCLRSTGVSYDVRQAQPYLVYDRMDFDIPVGEKGDNYDRYLVRMEEMRQSIRIVEQALYQIPDGPVRLEDPRFTMPPKQEVYTNIEALMNHFKLIFDGIRPPEGEIYQPVEGGNGELGFYLVSNGTGRPHKCRVRPPCFAIMQGLGKMIAGGMIADIVATFGTVNMIAGENDR